MERNPSSPPRRNPRRPRCPRQVWLPPRPRRTLQLPRARCPDDQSWLRSYQRTSGSWLVEVASRERLTRDDSDGSFGSCSANGLRLTASSVPPLSCLLSPSPIRAAGQQKAEYEANPNRLMVSRWFDYNAVHLHLTPAILHRAALLADADRLAEDFFALLRRQLKSGGFPHAESAGPADHRAIQIGVNTTSGGRAAMSS